MIRHVLELPPEHLPRDVLERYVDISSQESYTAIFPHTDKLFERFPNVRLASVENGSEFLGDLFHKLSSTARKIPGYFRDDPADSFREHVWINPFWEDDPYEIVELMGADHVIFGSDWPHIEGMPEPLDYAKEIKNLDDASRRLVMRDNALALTERRPA